VIPERAYLNTRETATYLGVSKTWLDHQRLSGGGPPYSKIGKAKTSLVRYYIADLDAWMRQCRTESPSSPVPHPSPAC